MIVIVLRVCFVSLGPYTISFTTPPSLNIADRTDFFYKIKTNQLRKHDSSHINIGLTSYFHGLEN